MKIETLTRLAPGAKIGWPEALLAEMPKWDIEGNMREAAFIGQIMVESEELRVFEENLHYHAARLVAVFPREFPTLEVAQPYNMNPRKIANRVYANRMGNGDEASGDGWMFRGMGPIQITGRFNYEAAARGTGLPLHANPGIILTPTGGSHVACWYFKSHGCNELADKGDIREITRHVAGVLTAYKQRVDWTERAHRLLVAEATS